MPAQKKVLKKNKKTPTKRKAPTPKAIFTKEFLKAVPEGDREGWSSAGMKHVGEMMYELAATRKPNAHDIRVTNIMEKSGERDVPYTIIRMVNEDMPFILDSVAAEVVGRGLRIESLFHPILSVIRDGRHRFKSVKETDEDAIDESCIFIRLEQILSDDDCADLARALDDALQNVRFATAEWPSMLMAMDAVIAEVSTTVSYHSDKHFIEAQNFLSFVRQNNFTFLGYKKYDFQRRGKKISGVPVARSALGVMKSRKDIDFAVGDNKPELLALLDSPWPLMVCKLMDNISSVHRRVPMDAVAIKIMSGKKVVGMHLFVGLFTSSTYSRRTEGVPIVRQKVRETTALAGPLKDSHSRKTLEHILEKMPRDVLFQVSTEKLWELVQGIMRLHEKYGVAVFAHRDVTQRHMTALVYLPKDKHSTRFRMGTEQILEEAFNGKLTNAFSTMDDSPLARLVLTFRCEENIDVDMEQIRQRLIQLAQNWEELLQKELITEWGKKEGHRLTSIYADAFPQFYKEHITGPQSVDDIRQLELLMNNGVDVRVVLRPKAVCEDGFTHLRVYHKNRPVSLSDIMPVLDNMGVKGISELPYQLLTRTYGEIWIHDFKLDAPDQINAENVKEIFEDAFVHVWQGNAENDWLNHFIVLAGLPWHQVRILRAYTCYLAQARFPHSRSYMQRALSYYPDIVRDIVDMFLTRHDPKISSRRDEKSKKISARIEQKIQAVERLDHDRILRAYKALVDNTLRTNYFKRDKNGVPSPCLAMKLDSQRIDFLPLPRPYAEIYVHSARVEAVHLRGGKIARGGLRWSDRHDDFRTEILGLLKAQMVKNTVIVPLGAKGGFIVKKPPTTGGRAAFQAEGVACYKLFIQSLLDLTDNNVKGKSIPPEGVVCHDEPDPYLVVAADKGTATFSDIANELAYENNFWLGDAFASGGSHGYDHKKMGITARGAWECVKLHFHDMNHDTQKKPFDVVGVGDMGGDVFGNGMLCSRHIRLIAAFNHMHIFCDPDPNPATSYEERKRLFKDVKGWDGYDKKKLSAGGAIYNRSDKTIKLTLQIRKRFGIEVQSVTPDDLIKAIMTSETDLIWFGGIGTFIKSSKESQADADDKANDNIRVNASDVKAKVIGEGANLGVTQHGRMEYSLHGGRINTDFIDNAGGVNCSDREVNIKILFSDVIARKKLSMPARNKLLMKMTESVAGLVLRDNYQQSQCLSLQEYMVAERLGQYGDWIRALEKSGDIQREREALPSDQELMRMASEGQRLPRAALSVVTAWSKIRLFEDVVNSDIPDSPVLEDILIEYFPTDLHVYKKDIMNHKLRREIIAAQIVNTIVNRMGAIFVMSRIAKTGATPQNVVRAFIATLEILDLPALWDDIEQGTVTSEGRMLAQFELYQVCKRIVTWFLRADIDRLRIPQQIKDFGPGFRLLKASKDKVMPAFGLEKIERKAQSLAERGIKIDIARDIAALKVLTAACDIVTLSGKRDGDALLAAAHTYFHIGEMLHFDWLRDAALSVPLADTWQARVVGGLVDDFYSVQAALTAAVLKSGVKVADDIAWTDWFATGGDMVTWLDNSVRELRAQSKVSLDMLVLARQWCQEVVEAVSDS